MITAASALQQSAGTPLVRIAQSTAIRRAFEMSGFWESVRRRGDWWTAINAAGKRVKIAHAGDVSTADHNGHSTCIHHNGHLVAVVYGRVTIGERSR